MAEKREGHGLVTTLTTGVKDIPRNASWLLGKAIGTEHSSSDDSGGTNGVVDGMRQAGAAVRDALPGGDSVEARLSRARKAADLAQEAEREALRTAERAHDLAAEADDTRKQEEDRIKQVETEQADAVRRRVEEARQRADEMVAKEQHEAEIDAHDVLSGERSQAEKRVSAAQAAAQEAQREAESRFEQATERLAEARSLADEASAAANDAAQEAQAQAARIAEDAQQEAESANEAVRRAEEMRDRTAQSAAAAARTAKDPSLPGSLTTLSKTELVRLASAQGVTGRSAMSKKQLISALQTKKGR